MREAWDDGERPIPSNALGMKINEGAMQFLPEDLKTAIERMRLIGSDTQHYEVKAAGQGLPESRGNGFRFCQSGRRHNHSRTG